MLFLSIDKKETPCEDACEQITPRRAKCIAIVDCGCMMIPDRNGQIVLLVHRDKENKKKLCFGTRMSRAKILSLPEHTISICSYDMLVWPSEKNSIIKSTAYRITTDMVPKLCYHIHIHIPREKKWHRLYILLLFYQPSTNLDEKKTKRPHRKKRSGFQHEGERITNM